MDKRLMYKVDVYRTARTNKATEQSTVLDVLQNFKRGVYKDQVERVRRIFEEEGKSAEYDKAKRNLPAVTFCGTFSPKRGRDNLQQHTGFVIGDLDNVFYPQDTIEKLGSDNFICAAWRSPSGSGVKFLVKIPVCETDAQYKRYLPGIKTHLDDALDIQVDFDKDGKDVSRLCFVCYDPGIYFNPDSAVFETIAPEPEPATPPPKKVYTKTRKDQDRWQRQAIETTVNMILQAPKGSRHYARRNAGFLAGGYTAGGLISGEEIMACLRTATEQNTDLPTDQAFKTVQDAFEAGKGKPITYAMKEAEYRAWLESHGYGTTYQSPAPNIQTVNGEPETAPACYKCTEFGNAERFVDRYKDQLRYNHDKAQWLIWDGTRWKPDVKQEVIPKGQAIIRDIYREAAEITDSSARQAVVKHAQRCERLKDVRNMIALSQSSSQIGLNTPDLDNRPELLNLKNGTYDLAQETFREHRKADLLSKQCNVIFDPAAKAPVWERFISEIFDDDQELIFFVRQALGYSLTADTREQCFFFCYGTGRNGKSTFFEAVTRMMGDYYLKASQDLLTIRHNNQPHIHDLAELPGKRLVVASELDQGQRLAESRIKDLTGQDPISARVLYKQPFTFKPCCTIWFFGNHKPDVRGTDLGIWRRFHMIPFSVTIREEKVDKCLDKKLLAELPGILNWILEGHQAWKEKGLIVPNIVKEAVAKYRTELDKVGQFIDDCCILDPVLNVSNKALYAAFCQWCKVNGEHELSNRKMGERLKEKDEFSLFIGTGNVRKWSGLTLKDQDKKGEEVNQ